MWFPTIIIKSKTLYPQIEYLCDNVVKKVSLFNCRYLSLIRYKRLWNKFKKAG